MDTICSCTGILACNSVSRDWREWEWEGTSMQGGRGQSTKKKKKRNELLVFVLLPQQCPSCTQPVVVAKADLLLESLLPPGEEEAAGVQGLVASCPLSAAWPSPGENGASIPSSSRREQQWQCVGCNAARHKFPHALQRDVVWLGLSCFQKQHPAPCWDWQMKGVVLPWHGRFNICRRVFYLWSRMQRRECWLGARQGDCAPHLPSVRRSGLPGLWGAGQNRHLFQM